MRLLWPVVAIAAAALSAPLAGTAQQPIVSPLPARPTMRPYPRPSYAPGHYPPGYHPPHNHNGYGYGNGNATVLIDGSTMNEYLRTPAPVPSPKRQATPRPNGAPDVFEEHSTGDNGQ